MHYYHVYQYSQLIFIKISLTRAKFQYQLHVVYPVDSAFEEHQVIQALFTLINVIKYFSGETSRGFEILNNTRAWINAVALIISSLPVSKSYIMLFRVNKSGLCLGGFGNLCSSHRGEMHIH